MTHPTKESKYPRIGEATLSQSSSYSECRHALHFLLKWQSRLLPNVKISSRLGISVHWRRTLIYGKYSLVLSHSLSPYNFGMPEFCLRELKDHSIQHLHFVLAQWSALWNRVSNHLLCNSPCNILWQHFCSSHNSFFSGINMPRCPTPSLFWSKFSEVLS